MSSRPWVLHVDLDQFLVAVEVRRRPELRGRPVVVGGAGDPTARRQVVASASYEARSTGVRAGMPLRSAHARCPDAVFLPSDRPAYEEASAQVMAVLRSLPVDVEVLGWDEAFLGARTDDPEVLAGQVRRVVADRTGLSCSVGIGDNTLQAKTATGFAKPAGVHRLTSRDWPVVMGERGTDALWGIGPRTAARLASLGIGTVAELAAADPAQLAATFGPTTGPWLQRLGRGVGSTRLRTEPWVPRSRSRETTFAEDVTDRARLDAVAAAMARELTEQVAAEGRRVVRAGVKVRTATFVTRTRAVTLPAPTTDPDAVAAAALTALARFELDRPVRLIGVRVDLAPPPT
ncbi:MAG TPA: DNA polymerase IV [Jiangellales bacterium]|nr:DNA polymerase IV [Jiangellales bacterium]